jgi:hypothetical protein
MGYNRIPVIVHSHRSSPQTISLLICDYTSTLLHIYTSDALLMSTTSAINTAYSPDDGPHLGRVYRAGI